MLFLLICFLISCNIYEKTGISSEESFTTCEDRVNYLLDKGEYDEALSLLNSTECSDMTDKERKINMAAAYLGKAGFSVPSLLKDLLNSTSEDNSEDKVTVFSRLLADKASATNLKWINNAKSSYEKTNVNCTNPQDPEEENICFLEGLTNIAKMGIGTTLLFKSENGTIDVKNAIDYWNSNEEVNCTIDVDANRVSDSLQFSNCALEFAAYHDNYTNSSGYLDIAGCSYELVNNSSTFGKTSKKFWILKLTIEANSTECSDSSNRTTYKILEYDNATSGNGTLMVVLTDGYCNNSTGVSCNELDPQSGCYPCPVVEEGEESLTVIGTIVESLNEGGEAIENIVQSSGEDNETVIKEAINDFKKDFCEENPSECACKVGDTWQECDESTLESADDIKIGELEDNSTGEVEVSAETQKLIMDYFTKSNE